MNQKNDATLKPIEANTSLKVPLTFRRYKEGNLKYDSWPKKIFEADHSYKCPVYAPHHRRRRSRACRAPENADLH